MAFQIQPNKKESENKTIRFPVPLIERINRALTGTDVSFSSFVIQACEFAGLFTRCEGSPDINTEDFCG